MQKVPTIVDGIPIYSGTARALHWLVALLLVVTIPIAFLMDNDKLFSEAAQNVLYDSHKLIGLLVLLLIVVRLVYRARNGVPQPDQSIQLWQHAVSGVVHWVLYGMLLVVPILGYVGQQLYGPIVLFDRIPIPGFLTPDEKVSDRIFKIHTFAAYVLIAIALLHIGAALYHYFIRKDNVLTRMLPSLRR